MTARSAAHGCAQRRRVSGCIKRFRVLPLQPGLEALRRPPDRDRTDRQRLRRAVGTFDPIFLTSFFDQSQFFDVNGVATITTAGVGCTNNTPVANEATCTWYLPEDEVLTTGAVALPEKGATKETIEHFLHTGTQINNAIVTSAVSTSAVTLPEPICFDDGILDGTGNPTVPHTIHNLAPGSTQDCSTPPAGCCFEFGPLFGVGSLNATIDWLLPGTEHCGTLTGNVPDPRTCAVSNNIAGLTNGYDLGLLPIGFPAAALITPHSGEAAVAAAWNYSAKLKRRQLAGNPRSGRLGQRCAHRRPPIPSRRRTQPGQRFARPRPPDRRPARPRAASRPPRQCRSKPDLPCSSGQRTPRRGDQARGSGW